jgi:hypothetical protein
MTVTVKHKHVQAFTLVETVTALIVSGAIFVGVFSIFAILNDKFEAELIRGELVAYCNYALDDVAQSIRLADEIIFRSFNNNAMITTYVNEIPQHTYAISEEDGILKNGMPIHEEVQYNANSTNAGNPRHKIFYNPQNKNGFLKYMLDEWKIYTLSENNDNTIYTAGKPLVLESSFVIELHTKLIMGWDEENPFKKLEFKRIAFSAGTYINRM